MVSGGLITTDGKKIALDRIFNASPTRTVPVQFKVGTGTATASLGDTDLGYPVPIANTESVDNCDATTGWTDSADMTVSVNTTTYKEGTGSLNLTKDGVASATISTYKTTTSLNFTSKELSIWIYIIDATALAKLTGSNCLTIRFGSDAANYYQWTKNSSDLAVGWNLIDKLTSATATTVGSPVITACDYTYIDLTATGAAIVWSAGDFAMDDIKLISSDDYLKYFEAGYPILDYANLKITMRGRISTIHANGYLISEFGIFNYDSSKLLFSRDVFSAISKSNTDEIIFEVVTQID